MKDLKYLDTSVVVIGVLVVLFSKSTGTTWTAVLIAAFGGALIGGAFAHMGYRSRRVKK